MEEHELLKQTLDAMYNSMRAMVDEYRENLAHLSDEKNPHNVKKSKVDLTHLMNWPMAVSHDVDLKSDVTYLPIWGTTRYVNRNIIPQFEAHKNDKNNPHEIKAAQLDMHTIAEINQLLSNRLKRNARAYSTRNVQGKTRSDLYTETRTNIRVADIGSGRFPAERLASPAEVTRALNSEFVEDMVLTGAGTFVNLRESSGVGGIVVVNGIHGSNAAALNAAANTSAAIGDYLIGKYRQSRSSSGRTSTHIYMMLARRNPNGTTSRVF